MKRAWIFLNVVIILPVLVAACNLPMSDADYQKQVLANTAAQGAAVENGKLVPTLVALQTQVGRTPEAGNPTEQGASPVPATATAEPTVTQTITSTQTGAPQVVITPVASLTPIPCNRAKFVSDISVPDGTRYSKGAAFTKIWRIKNDGNCAWTTGYALVFDHGASMNGPSLVHLPRTVEPGATIDLGVPLTAPSSNGTYQGFWRLQDDHGNPFGIGTSADVSFWVRIVVGVIIYDTSTPVVTGKCKLVSSSPAVYSSYEPNSDIDARWKIRNTSGSTWHTSQVDYKYISGTRMYKYDSAYDLQSDVSDDHTITIVVDMVTPDDAGTYTMTWGVVKSSTRLCTMSVTIKVK